MIGDRTVSYTNSYRGRTYEYRFALRQQGANNWRAYILRAPAYGLRSTSAHATHRLGSGRHKYICWSGVVATVEDMKKIAKVWCDATTVYIATGESMDAACRRIVQRNRG